ncbi:MAG TPA: isoamylase early set domain-containing protein [Spirochaetia bacterium]|nr:isoamylase early set domain-containing protein [Spirochaetia bacterium]
MLHKKALGGKKFQVTFTMPSIEGVETLHLCGEFNGWSDTATPMRREPDGSWTASLVLEGGKSYVFRYRDNHQSWHNDWSADAYVPNQFGSENSVLDLAAQEASRGDSQGRERRRGPAPRGKQAARSPQRRRKG